MQHQMLPYCRMREAKRSQSAVQRGAGADGREGEDEGERTAVRLARKEGKMRERIVQPR